MFVFVFKKSALRPFDGLRDLAVKVIWKFKNRKENGSSGLFSDYF